MTKLASHLSRGNRWRFALAQKLNPVVVNKSMRHEVARVKRSALWRAQSVPIRGHRQRQRSQPVAGLTSAEPSARMAENLPRGGAAA
jgi:hypothetical protein